MKNLKNIELYLLDMDGTIYLENELIPGAAEFIAKLIDQKKNYVFLTNNSSVNKQNYLDKLQGLNIPCTEKNLFSSGMATGIFLKTQRPKSKVYLVGTKHLRSELLGYGVELTEDKPDIVLVGFDRELTYEKVELACRFLDQGAEFLATNADFLYPLKGNRFIPDCASICQMLTNATGKKPFFIGKPNPYMIDLLAEEFHLSKDRIAIIGDRLYTDIASGINAGIVTICVLSGESSQSDVDSSPFHPDYVFSSVAQLHNLI
ncbi:MAG: HAD-IIA family hydrolase [Acholeplasmataceae bacterium]|jgi:4-nitrophenyl phosphatase|nr:HAD-IIA family hydrolase [Acholeplasmataceae bacterium]